MLFISFSILNHLRCIVDPIESNLMNSINNILQHIRMFGSALVEPYIGELWIASTADIMMKDDGLSGMIDETMSEEEKRELVQEQMRATNKQN